MKFEEKVKEKLYHICEEFLQLLKNHLIPSAKTDESV